jgi:hypothetical protein
VDNGHREVQPFLAGDVADQIDDELQVRLAAGAAEQVPITIGMRCAIAARSISRKSRRIAIVEQKGLPDPR